MVHALEEIKRLLKPDGFLIDIHPIRKAPLINVYHGSNLLFTESDPGYDSSEGLRHADDALEEVVRRRLFRIEGENGSFYFPLTTSILVSVILTIVLNVIARLLRK